jgi:60 kDa SS-A/Ro ribonucleoprotein
MSRVNQQKPPVRTHEGAPAAKITPKQQLLRSVMSCMLWEDTFYEDGVEIAERIRDLVHKVPLDEVRNIAVEARTRMKLRHVPLLIAREMARHPLRAANPGIVSQTIYEVIQRPDELAEFLAIYWMDDPMQPISKQAKLGLARAFTKFNEHQLAKYNGGKKDIKLRDVLFLCHAKPADLPDDAQPWTREQRAHYNKLNEFHKRELVQHLRPNGFTDGELLYGRLVHNQLQIPDTWEVQLSAGANKNETFTRLMNEGKLGALAFLRNLRNMNNAGVSQALIRQYGDQLQWDRVLPFRFIAAAQHAPDLKPDLERWMFKCTKDMQRLSGNTLLLVDISGSMMSPISGKSDLSRTHAAQALAMLLHEICETVVIVPFEDHVHASIHPKYAGFALANKLKAENCGTDLGGAVRYANHRGYDRLIVLTDEQSASLVDNPVGRGYMINVAAYKNGVGYGDWLHIDGFSEAVVDYIQQHEAS